MSVNSSPTPSRSIMTGKRGQGVRGFDDPVTFVFEQADREQAQERLVVYDQDQRYISIWVVRLNAVLHCSFRSVPGHPNLSFIRRLRRF